MKTFLSIKLFQGYLPDHWCNRKFWFGGAQNWKILWHFSVT